MLALTKSVNEEDETGGKLKYVVPTERCTLFSNDGLFEALDSDNEY